jgi:transposase
MRYELSDYEWTTIKPMLPNKPRGVRRVNDRRVLKGIFWVLRSGAPWRDLPETYGPRTICYNRFVRWRQCAEPGIAKLRQLGLPSEGAGLAGCQIKAAELEELAMMAEAT